MREPFLREGLSPSLGHFLGQFVPEALRRDGDSQQLSMC
jgi:hypothetical protein